MFLSSNLSASDACTGCDWDRKPWFQPHKPSITCRFPPTYSKLNARLGLLWEHALILAINRDTFLGCIRTHNRNQTFTREENTPVKRFFSKFKQTRIRTLDAGPKQETFSGAAHPNTSVPVVASSPRIGTPHADRLPEGERLLHDQRYFKVSGRHLVYPLFKESSFTKCSRWLSKWLTTLKLLQSRRKTQLLLKLSFNWAICFKCTSQATL